MSYSNAGSTVRRGLHRYPKRTSNKRSSEEHWVETLDTNVVLRIVYKDDPVQAAQAVAAWQRAVDGGGIYLTTTVLVELPCDS